MELLQTGIEGGMEFLLEGMSQEGKEIGRSKVIETKFHQEEKKGQTGKAKHLQREILVKAGHLVRKEIQEKMIKGDKIKVSKDKDILNHQREQGKMTREDKKEV